MLGHIWRMAQQQLMDARLSQCVQLHHCRPTGIYIHVHCKQVNLWWNVLFRDPVNIMGHRQTVHLHVHIRVLS